MRDISALASSTSYLRPHLKQELTYILCKVPTQYVFDATSSTIFDKYLVQGPNMFLMPHLKHYLTSILRKDSNMTICKGSDMLTGAAITVLEINSPRVRCIANISAELSKPIKLKKDFIT